MSEQARVGDTGSGICYGHLVPTPFTTTFTSGANSCLVNGKPACVVGSTGITSCGHTTTATTGSSINYKEGKPSHRVGDAGVVDGGLGTYIVDTGSPDTEVK